MFVKKRKLNNSSPKSNQIFFVQEENILALKNLVFTFNLFQHWSLVCNILENQDRSIMLKHIFQSQQSSIYQLLSSYFWTNPKAETEFSTSCIYDIVKARFQLANISFTYQQQLEQPQQVVFIQHKFGFDAHNHIFAQYQWNQQKVCKQLVVKSLQFCFLVLVFDYKNILVCFFLFLFVGKATFWLNTTLEALNL